MELSNAIIIALIGVVAGLLSGMLGIGGAVVVIPALVMLLGFSQQMAQGTTLIMMVLPVGALAAWQYYQNGYVDMKAALMLAFFFFIGGYFGAKFAVHIPELVLKRAFAILLIIIAFKILFTSK